MSRDNFNHELNAAVNEFCSCGGRGPNDEGVCPACQVWHRIKARARDEAQLEDVDDDWTDVYWRGKPVLHMSRKELIEALAESILSRG